MFLFRPPITSHNAFCLRLYPALREDGLCLCVWAHSQGPLGTLSTKTLNSEKAPKH